MNGVYVGNFGGTDHRGNMQVAFAGARRANAERFIGKADMQ